ncbi:DUF1003 domain-containing protein [Chitinophaga agrisoli]|uniref:DUF1003 domain-containing protein n=1 Tax=Chitinophaga agrisoli TaxID=2607653 RepID=A0A5B2W432_9BACT|nr:DUF1003 domain-containing protein [Chitinophaga agrisoli]KAA2245618.1 DUF1003 domain-containing protein [Chitinophaga agrisoli]
MQTFVSDISGRHFPATEKVSFHAIRQELLELIKQEHPGFNNRCSLSISELNLYRQRYFENLFSREIGELTELEKTVMEKMRDHETLTDKLEESAEATPLSTGQRLADKIADFGGSWTFIIIFMVFILLWMALNVFWLINKGFDPYPFILLNLILSCIASLQAPLIMMSQNRQEEKDRQRAKNDYMINLKSELEVRILHEKMDHLIMRQQQDVLELQQTQVEMLNEITHAISRLYSKNGDGNHKHTNDAK